MASEYYMIEKEVSKALIIYLFLRGGGFACQDIKILNENQPAMMMMPWLILNIWFEVMQCKDSFFIDRFRDLKLIIKLRALISSLF